MPEPRHKSQPSLRDTLRRWAQSPEVAPAVARAQAERRAAAEAAAERARKQLAKLEGKPTHRQLPASGKRGKR